MTPIWHGLVVVLKRHRMWRGRCFHIFLFDNLLVAQQWMWLSRVVDVMDELTHVFEFAALHRVEVAARVGVFVRVCSHQWLELLFSVDVVLPLFVGVIDDFYWLDFQRNVFYPIALIGIPDVEFLWVFRDNVNIILYNARQQPCPFVFLVLNNW